MSHSVFRPEEYSVLLWTKITRVSVVYDYEFVDTGVTTTVHFEGEATQWLGDVPDVPGVPVENYMFALGNALNGPVLGAPQLPEEFSFGAVGTGLTSYDNGDPSVPFTTITGSISPVPWTDDINYVDTMGDMTQSLWYTFLGNGGANGIVGWGDFDLGATISVSGTLPDTTFSYTIILHTT